MTQSLLALMEVLYVDHVAVTTPVFEQTLADYLGLPGSRLLRGPAFNPAQKVSYAFVMLREGMTVEVLGLAEGSPIERHVNQGGGPYHFCYAVGNMEVSIARAESAGAKLLASPVADVAFDGRRVAFLFHEAQGVFELVEAFPCGGARPTMAGRNKDVGRTAFQKKPAPQTDTTATDTNERLRTVFGRVFPAVKEGDMDTVAINVTPGWDSLAQIRLVMEIEAEFGIDILPNDIGKLTSYRIILDQLERDVR
jgi:acyl carrier protein/catechol 2,3-dioxygenase-like lactoylglutathione lyase family enzyme